MTYKIHTVSQSLYHLCATNSAAVAARIVNTPKGWVALRGAEGEDENAVNVSHMVNQHGGGDQVAKALGL